MDAIDAIRRRRSYSRLGDPAPGRDELLTMLEAAGHAPDHGTLRPWRFVVLEGEAQERFGEILADAYLARCRRQGVEPVEAKLEKERTKLGRAPVVIVAIYERRPSSKIPGIEQRDAVNAAVQNLLLAAEALGFGTMWRTGDPAYDQRVFRALDMDENDDIVGFVYVGTPVEGSVDKPERRVDPLDYTSWWTPPT